MWKRRWRKRPSVIWSLKTDRHTQIYLSPKHHVYIVSIWVPILIEMTDRWMQGQIDRYQTIQPCMVFTVAYFLTGCQNLCLVCVCVWGTRRRCSLSSARCQTAVCVYFLCIRAGTARWRGARRWIKRNKSNPSLQSGAAADCVFIVHVWAVIRCLCIRARVFEPRSTMYVL